MFHLFFCPQIHHHMISAIGLAQGIIEFCYLLLVLFPVGKLDPQFPWHLIEGDDFFADQLTRLSSSADTFPMINTLESVSISAAFLS